MKNMSELKQLLRVIAGAIGYAQLHASGFGWGESESYWRNYSNLRHVENTRWAVYLIDCVCLGGEAQVVCLSFYFERIEPKQSCPAQCIKNHGSSFVL